MLQNWLSMHYRLLLPSAVMGIWVATKVHGHLPRSQRCKFLHLWCWCVCTSSMQLCMMRCGMFAINISEHFPTCRICPLIAYFTGGSSMPSIAHDLTWYKYDNIHPVCAASKQCSELVPALGMRWVQVDGHGDVECLLRVGGEWRVIVLWLLVHTYSSKIF